MTEGQRGRSMVEMLGVLAIIGVLSVGGIAGYSQAMSKFKITKTLDQVQTLITNMRTLYASQRKVTAISAEKAYEMGILNDETYDPSTKKGLNPFGGQINFADATGANAGRAFTIEYTGLTAEACVRLATADWGADASSGLVKIVIGSGTSGTTYSWTSAEHPLPVDFPDAVEKCHLSPIVKWEYK